MFCKQTAVFILVKFLVLKIPTCKRSFYTHMSLFCWFAVDSISIKGVGHKAWFWVLKYVKTDNMNVHNLILKSTFQPFPSNGGLFKTQMLGKHPKPAIYIHPIEKKYPSIPIIIIRANLLVVQFENYHRYVQALFFDLVDISLTLGVFPKHLGSNWPTIPLNWLKGRF